MAMACQRHGSSSHNYAGARSEMLAPGTLLACRCRPIAPCSPSSFTLEATSGEVVLIGQETAHTKSTVNINTTLTLSQVRD